MIRHVAGRLVRLFVTAFGMISAAFLVMRLIPGDPALTILGPFATEDRLAMLRADLKLDASIWSQYLDFLGGALVGDLGRSAVTGRPAVGVVLDALPDSLVLAVAGVGIAVVLGIPAGVLAAKNNGRFQDYAVTTSTIVGISFPVFWVGIVAIFLFAYTWPIFPATGAGSGTSLRSSAYHLVLPATVLGISLAAYIARLARSSMLEVLNLDYITVARAMGVRERRLVWIDGLRNAIIPVLSVIGVTFAWAIGNAILIEIVFARPGVGSVLIKAIFARDYQLVQASVVILALVTAAVNMLLDVVYATIDPRIASHGA